MLLVERFQSAFIAQFGLLVVLFVLEEYVAQIVEAVRVVLIKIDGVLVGKNRLIVHVLRPICNSKEEEDLSDLHLETFVDLLHIKVLIFRCRSPSWHLLRRLLSLHFLLAAIIGGLVAVFVEVLLLGRANDLVKTIEIVITLQLTLMLIMRLLAFLNNFCAGSC